jgi:hypothetical protein
MDGAAEAGADAVGDALLIAVDADERRKQNEQKNDQRCEGQIEKSAKSVGAESWWGVCVDGFAILVGGIHFRHKSVASCWLLIVGYRSPARFASHNLLSN